MNEGDVVELPGRGRAGREQRAAPRWVPAARVRARVRGSGVDTHGADVADLSTNGALLRFDAGVGLDATLERFEVELELGSRRYVHRARCAWTRAEGGRLTCGLEFVDGDGASPGLDVREMKLDPKIALRAPASLCLRRRVLPLCVVDGHVHVACADLRDGDALRALERYFEEPLRAQQAEPEALQQVLRKLFGEVRVVREADADDPVALGNELLHAAWMRQASDVHIDAERDSVRIRLRVDGELEEYRRLPARAHAELVSRLKVQAGLDIAEKRAPQDGRFTHEFGGGSSVEIRAATLPTKHGERMTLRFLATSIESLTLERLGMAERDLEVFGRCIARPHGLVLATGPTGCGKTTTLYAAMQRILSQRSVNAITVQDPVEYDLPGVAQVEVDAAQKITFAKALRSILRHDPDVILIGEIRDEETVDIAIKAALTGHLVLATLHTNSAASAVTRLADMGADPFLIAATLRLVVAQRLVRRLCPYCAVPEPIGASAARALGCPELAGTPAGTPRGCVFCAGRGYAGRIGIFELLELDDELAQAVDGGAHETELARRALEHGARTLRDDAREKLVAGTASLHDVLAAVAT